MQHKLKYLVDDHSDPTARSLVNGFQRLEDDLQAGKNVASINHDLRDLREIVKRLDSSAMDHGDSDQLEKWLDRAIDKYRK